MVAEWSYPAQAIPAGFDIDFLIHANISAYTTLFRHEKGTNVIDVWQGDSYFRPEGKGDIQTFLDQYETHYNLTRESGFISIPTGNHDLPRIALGRDTVDLKIAYTFLLTMPGVPFVYYGDEIGMKNLTETPSKEGGYVRTAARTPMQWGAGKNFGFSDSDTPYLPVDTDPQAPTVAAQIPDGDSLLNYTKRLIGLRKDCQDLHGNGDFEVCQAGYPFVYRRGSLVVVINPKDEPVRVKCPGATACLIGVNATLSGDTVTTQGKGAAVIQINS